METILNTGGMDVLFDPERVGQPVPGWFDPAWWRQRDAVAAEFAGRGRTLAVEGSFGQGVLRIYQRGGLVRHLIRDRYLFLGQDRVRSFREWRVLRELWQAGFPVPEPLAAASRRTGPAYRAALLTKRIPGAVTLAERLARSPLAPHDWSRLGRTLSGFFEAGLRHADLNARNILVDPAGRFWVLDFDRAVLRRDPAEGSTMVLRLVRSLDKLGLAYDRTALLRGVSPG